MKLRALTSDLAEIRASNRTDIRGLPAVVSTLREDNERRREDLRRRLTREREGGPTRSVLLLDDDEHLRGLMRTALAELGVPVLDAGTVPEARALYLRHRPAVVVVDLLLEGGERGDEFIRGLGRTPRAVLVSGADRVTLRAAAGPCNAVPLSREDLSHLPELVRGLLHAVHPPLWCRSTPDRFLSVSDELAALLGYAADELVGMAWRDLVHPDDIARSEARQREGRGHGVTGHVQRMRHRDGSWVALSWDVAPMTDGELYALARVV